MAFTFSEASGLAKSIYGDCQMPIKMFLTKRGEEMEKNSILKDVFAMGTSDNFGDMLTGMTAMDGFDPVGENGAYPGDSMQEGYQKLIKYETWKDSFSISKEMIEDSKILDMSKQPEQFMQGYQRTREKFGAALYGAAIAGQTSTVYRKHTFDTACADGMPLFHTAHKPKVFGPDQSNCFSNAFSAKNLGYVETAMQNFCGENGEILEVAPDTILIPNDADLKYDVFAAIGADKEPTTANNAFNYQYGRWNIIVWPYLNQFIPTGIKPWILMDSKFNKLYQGAVWNDRVQLDVRSTIDDNTDANVWRGRSRFNAVFNDWRFAAVGGITGATTI